MGDYCCGCGRRRKEVEEAVEGDIFNIFADSSSSYCGFICQKCWDREDLFNEVEGYERSVL